MPCVMFGNELFFYGEELLAPRLTPKLEEHPLSAVRDCLFSILNNTSAENQINQMLSERETHNKRWYVRIPRNQQHFSTNLCYITPPMTKLFY
jgi:hypothetical protein